MMVRWVCRILVSIRVKTSLIVAAMYLDNVSLIFITTDYICLKYYVRKKYDMVLAYLVILPRPFSFPSSE